VGKIGTDNQHVGERYLDMAATSDDALEALRQVWSGSGQTIADIDEVCGVGNKGCRNAVHMTFDGYAEDGEDVAAAWRNRLQQEGKFNAKGGTLRDLILGPEQDS
jgi:hypothetical protein